VVFNLKIELDGIFILSDPVNFYTSLTDRSPARMTLLAKCGYNYFPSSKIVLLENLI
jgi:hypothetical protein